jgi:hypothetical protein
VNYVNPVTEAKRFKRRSDWKMFEALNIKKTQLDL